MRRPALVHFLAIKTDEFISIRASITLKKERPFSKKEIESMRPKMPIEAYKLLRSFVFHIKFVGIDSHKNEIYTKYDESDQFGNFNFKIPLTETTTHITAFLIYEIQSRPGLELLLGTFLPLIIKNQKKLVICDFDKTLVETKYSSTKEVYNSLIRPLEYFPTVQEGVRLIKKYIKNGHHPFILSASPHFYEDAMRDWLYKNEIYTAGIFLKDYRQVFSLFEGELKPKDIRMQGLYKLNHLLDILQMTGIPDRLVLIGDNFESDPIIYLTLAKLLLSDVEAWAIWKQLIKEKTFKIGRKQNFMLLNKIYQIHNLLSLRAKSPIHEGPPVIKIYIRMRKKDDQILLSPWYDDVNDLIELFE
jgi:hypothetical protein